MAPPFMKGWLQIITNEHKFKKFDANLYTNQQQLAEGSRGPVIKMTCIADGVDYCFKLIEK